MFTNPSLITRVAVGKTIGLVIGLTAFVLLPHFLPDADWQLRWGILLWYVTFGAIIGMMGVFTFHPVLKMPFPWWFRAPVMGAWLNFVLAFFAYDEMYAVIESVFGTNGMISSPFWFAAEGAVIALIMDYFATRLGGEGKETVGR